MGGYPPFVITEFQGNRLVAVTGIVDDMLTVFEEKYPQYHRSYKEYPRKRANKMMEHGDEGIDLMLNSPMFVNERVTRHYDFTDTIFHTQDVVITKQSSPIHYQAPEDLYGKQVGTLCGYGYGDFDVLFDRGEIEKQCVQTHIQNLRKLKAGRIDAYFGNIHVSPYYMKQLHLDPKTFNFSDAILFEFDLVFLVKNTKSQFLQDLNSFIHEITQNNVLANIVNRYTR